MIICQFIRISDSLFWWWWDALQITFFCISHSHSRLLEEEGAVFTSFILVRDGVFRETELIEALNAPALVDFPGASGTRNLHDNLSDLRAQVAANQKVTDLLNVRYFLKKLIIFIDNRELDLSVN